MSAPGGTRWVDAAALLAHLEDRHDDLFYRYTSLAALATPAPDSSGPRRDGARRTRNRVPVVLPPRVRHGTPQAYKRRGCRCDVCTDATRDQRRRERARARAQAREQAA